MAQEQETSKSGVWYDSKTGKVVESRPVTGVQLVPPGGTVTPARRVVLDRYRAIERGTEEEPATAVETAAETPEQGQAVTVETAVETERVDRPRRGGR